MMLIIEKIKSKSEELSLSNYDLEQIFISNYSYHHKWETNKYPDSPRVEFYNFLLEFNFKYLEHKGGGPQDDRDYYETEDCHSVFELNGELFKLEYLYRSYDGYTVPDFWNWKSTTATQKIVTYYELEKPAVYSEKQKTVISYE
jgi:hypothetical protein